MNEWLEEHELPSREELIAERLHALMRENERMRLLLIEIIAELDEAIQALDDVTEYT